MTEYTINMSEWIENQENFIHPTAVIGPNVTLGKGNYIGPYCIIGYPAEHKQYWDKGIGSVIIGDNNHFTGLVTIDAGTETDTIIFNNCWFLKHSHVGHDAIIHDNVTISCGAKIGGHAVIHANTNIGLNACIHQKVQVPEGVMVGMNAAVTKKTVLESFRKYAGVPAKDIGSNMGLNKVFLIEDVAQRVKSGDIIYFDMGPSPLGDYSAVVYENDEGRYIKAQDNWFQACKGYRINEPYENRAS